MDPTIAAPTHAAVTDLGLAKLVQRSYGEPEEFGLFRARCETAPDGARLVGFSGTVDVVDWMSNFRVWMTRAGWARFPGRYHAGLSETWRLIGPAIAGMVSRERGGGRRPAGWHIAGHSRGGWIAAFAAMLIRERYPGDAVDLVTFGVPRFGDRVAVAHLAKLLPRARHYRLSYDPIPGLPPWRPWWPYADPEGTVGLPRPSADARMIDWRSIPIVRRHDLARYVAALEAPA